MKIRFTLSYVLIMVTAVTVTCIFSCKKTIEDESVPGAALVVKAKQWFQDNAAKYPTVWSANKQKLDWSKASLVHSASNNNYLIVPFKELVRFELKAMALSRQVIFRVSGGAEIEGANVLETFAPESYLTININKLAAQYLDKKLSSFTGSIFYYEFDYTPVEKTVYRNGLKRGEGELRAKDGFTFGKNAALGGRSGIAGRTEACYAVTLGYFDEYGNFTPLYFIGIFCNVEEGSVNNIDWANYEGSNGNTGNEEGPTVEQILDAFDNSIKDSLTTACLKTILANIKGLNGSQFGDIIKKLSQNLSGWNWVLYEGATSNNNNAETIPLGPNGCVTILNPTRIQHYTELALVRTMLHEAVHAFLENYFYNNPLAAGLDYPQLLNLYQNETDTALSQHIVMGTNFVGSIANALKFYGQGHGYDLPDEVYNDMAWGGLYGETSGVPAFNALTPFVRERIRNRNAAENSSTPRDTEIPSGTQACNF